MEQHTERTEMMIKTNSQCYALHKIIGVFLSLRDILLNKSEVQQLLRLCSTAESAVAPIHHNCTHLADYYTVHIVYCLLR